MNSPAWLGQLALIGPASISLMLLVMGVLSQRLGRAIHARPYYLVFYLAAALVAVAVVVRLVNLGTPLAIPEIIDTPATSTEFTAPMATGWVVLYNGLLALGVTLGLLVAWHYWSWLLAERD